MSEFEISIIHPSRGRANRCMETALHWLNNASNTIPIEYIISIDDDDPSRDLYQELNLELLSQASKDSKYEVWLIKNSNRSAIDAINNGAKFTTNNLLVVVSDDFECFPNWDVFLKTNLEDKKDFIVKTSDGIQDWLITLPIMDIAYYNRFGYIYYPEYKHLFCDTEMTSVADLLGRKIDLRSNEFVFRHLHPCAGLSEADEINKKNDATWEQGETLYNTRAEINFGLKIGN